MYTWANCWRREVPRQCCGSGSAGHALCRVQGPLVPPSKWSRPCCCAPSALAVRLIFEHAEQPLDAYWLTRVTDSALDARGAGAGWGLGWSEAVCK